MVPGAFDGAPLVSVIVRTTHRSTLGEALASIDTQTYPNIEIVVVDALGTGISLPPGSASARPRHIVSTGAKLGYSPAANAGLDAARGAYLIFLDDDDYFDGDHLASLWAVLRAAPDCRLAYSGTRLVQADGSPRGEMALDFSVLRMYEQNLVTICSVLFSRALLASGCRFDSTLGIFEDWDFWLQAMQHTHFKFSGRVTTNWRADTGGSGAGAGGNFTPNHATDKRTAIWEMWADERAWAEAAFDQHAAAAASAFHAKSEAAFFASARQALALDPFDPALLNMAAMFHADAGRIGEAEAALVLATRYNREAEDWLTLNRAQLYRRAGAPDLARKVLDQLLAKSPHHEQARALRVAIGGNPPTR